MKLPTSKDSKTYELLLLPENVSNALSVRYSGKDVCNRSSIRHRREFLGDFNRYPRNAPIETGRTSREQTRRRERTSKPFWLLSLKTMLSSGSGLLNDAEEEDYETEDVSYTTTTSTPSGSILIAILKWSKFVDKFFEGAEPCPICYQVLAKSNGRKPEATCRQSSAIAITVIV